MIELGWIDNLIKSIRPYIAIRKEDQTLILVPNQVYRLNSTGFYLLERLLGGERIEELTFNLEEREKEDVFAFFCDLRALVMGCVRDGEKRRAIEYLPYERPFTELPVLSELAVTTRCNLNCRFCYNSHKDDDLDTENLKGLIDVIALEAKVPSISFTGGEPTLRDDLPHLIRHAKDLGLWTNLITNGTRLTRNYVRILKDSGLDSIQISIEAADPLTHDYLTTVKGSFNRTIIGIKSALESGIKVHTNTTVNRANRDSIILLPRFLKRLGLNRFSMNLMIPIGKGREDRSLWLSYQEMADLVPRIRREADKEEIEFIWYSPTPYCLFNPVASGLGNKSCAACEGLLSISARGEIMPCSSWPGSVGSLLNQSFKEIWFSPRAKEIRNWIHEPCQGCEDRDLCRGACPLFWEVLPCELHPVT